jgi:hypothetical protein
MRFDENSVFQTVLSYIPKEIFFPIVRFSFLMNKIKENYLEIYFYLFVFSDSDDPDEIENQLITTTKSKKCFGGPGSSVKRTMDGNPKAASKKIIPTDRSNSIRNGIVTFLLWTFSK